MLVIDIGNTNTVLAIYKNKILIQKKRISSKPIQFKKNIEKYLKKYNKKLSKLNAQKKCIISSVVPSLNILVKNVALKNSFNFFFLNFNNIPFNLNIKYELNKIGADRIANYIAVIKSNYNNSIIVDFGTATTFDVIKNNTYEGGLIFPGVNIALNSLINNAALLKKTKIIKIKKIVSTNSHNSIQSGFYWGYLSVVNGIINKIIKEKKFKPKIILTGGLSYIFKSQIILNPIIDENLTLEGLRIIGEKIYE